MDSNLVIKFGTFWGTWFSSAYVILLFLNEAVGSLIGILRRVVREGRVC